MKNIKNMLLYGIGYILISAIIGSTVAFPANAAVEDERKNLQV
ncbi:MAG: hypothetical protein ACLRZ9_03995 [Eubacterium sp.]